MERCDILMAGTGSLGEAAIFALATAPGGPMRIAVAGRNPERCRWLAFAANARAAVFGLPNVFVPIVLDWTSAERIAEGIRPLAPAVVVQTASMQSPWDLAKANAWSALVKKGGYGLGTPFHTILPARMARALAMAAPRAVLINGCYPDVANSVIVAMGLPIETGFGNVDIVAIAVAAALGLRDPGKVRMLAQWEPHVSDFQKRPADRKKIDPLIWIDGRRVDGFAQRFEAIQFPPASDDSLNQITGCTVAPMALAYLRGTPYVGHAAGPFGLPGGYPVTIRERRLELDLPEGISRDAAIDFNKHFEEAEGVVIDEAAKRVRLAGKAHAAMNEVSPELARGYPIASLDDLEAAVTELSALRTKLGA